MNRSILHALSCCAAVLCVDPALAADEDVAAADRADIVVTALPAAKGDAAYDIVVIDRDRLTGRPGDFFVDPLPSADAYILMEVIHDWPDAEAAAILEAVRRAASPGARVLIIENVLVDVGADPRGHTLDVIMLTVTGGRERTGNELGELLMGAGFAPSAVIDTSGPLRIVEGIAT